MSDHEKRVHDLLYSTESRTEMCERVVELEEENDKLREEAEQLRSCEAGYIAMRAARDKLDAENDKLRELVLCLLTCASDGAGVCDTCPMNGGPGIWEFEDFCDGLLGLVHELRIEVSEE